MPLGRRHARGGRRLQDGLRPRDPGAAHVELVARLQAGDGAAKRVAGEAEALALADLRDVALFALSDPFLELRLAALG